MENGHRPRHYRTRALKSEAGSIVAFVVVFALLLLVFAAIYSGTIYSLVPR